MIRQLIARDPLAERSLGRAIGDFLWAPLLRLMMLAAFVGVISGVAAARVLASYDAELLVLGALVDAMLRQILPLIVGIFASGSVSVEIASRLAAMTLAREIDALEAMGHDPVDYALAAPVSAVVLASPAHMIAAALAALLGAALPLHASAHVAWRVLAHAALSNAAAMALLIGMTKVLLFSLIALCVGVTVGTGAVRVASDIGRRAGVAFTAGLLGIFAAGAVWAGLA